MIVFRADANKNIGMGHIMRCLSVADAATKSGLRCLFILADESVSALVQERGYKAIILNSDYENMEEECWPKIKADLVIIDSYYVTPVYFRETTYSR